MDGRETATTVFKFPNDIAPDHLSGLFTRISYRKPINLRNAETDLIVPSMKTSNGQKAFGFHRAKIWKELGHESKQAPSLSSAKNKTK